MPHLYLSAIQKSSGKTTLTIGLCREFRARGLVVQPFKKGPDFIDPLWLGEAAGRSCFNLDYHTMEPEEIAASFAREQTGADLAVIEGNVGLFDSIEVTGTHSNAELAKQLGAPVVLAINAQGMGRGIAPLLLGYRDFDPDLHLAGVILNKVGGTRHARNLIAAVEYYTDLPVLGVLERDASLGIAERHLGLMPSNEADAVQARIEAIRARVAEAVDVERLLALAERASPRLGGAVAEGTDGANTVPSATLRIGIARDTAFGFYYPDDLRALAMGGAELVPFSPLADPELPAVDALFIGGGFPEYHLAALEANRGMRQSIADFAARGGVVYAECGGLMYLCREIVWGSERRAMVGVLDAAVSMHERPQGRGYVRLRETEHFPWALRPGGIPEVQAHEFHHSALLQPHPDWVYGYRVLRGVGVDGAHDGIVQGQLLASYSHLRAVGGNPWTERFLHHISRNKARY